jgi:arsenate reductase (glutaredoxin)
LRRSGIDIGADDADAAAAVAAPDPPSCLETLLPMAITFYGIPNCDTVKRARAWLNEHGLPHSFHDFKKAGVPADGLDSWLAAAGWERLLNRKGTAWRGLPEATREAVTDADSARAVMLQHASTIKRPVIDWGNGHITVGFDPAAWPPR